MIDLELDPVIAWRHFVKVEDTILQWGKERIVRASNRNTDLAWNRQELSLRIADRSFDCGGCTGVF